MMMTGKHVSSREDSEVEAEARLEDPVYARIRAVTAGAAARDLVAGLRPEAFPASQPVIDANAGVGPRHVKAGDIRSS